MSSMDANKAGLSVVVRLCGAPLLALFFAIGPEVTVAQQKGAQQPLPSELKDVIAEAASLDSDLKEVSQRIEKSSDPSSELFNRRSDLFEERGDLYMAAGEHAIARADYSKAIQLSRVGTYRQTLKHMNACLKMGDYEQAIADATSAAKVQPPRSRPYAFLALILAGCPDDKLRDPVRALEMATLAAALSKEDITVERALAAAHSASGDFELAIVHQEKAIKIAKDRTTKDMRRWLDDYKAQKPFRLVPELDDSQ